MAKISEYLKIFFIIIVLLQIAPPILKNIKQQWLDNLDPKNLVGLVHINKPIYGAQCYNVQLVKYFKDPEIKAILLKIDCPGGASGASQAVALEILELKKLYPKPIVTYSENVCASGAYYIASMTDYIVTTGSCVVGSIGSKICTQFKLKELLTDYKVSTVSISSGSYKNVLDPFVDITDDQKVMLQQIADDSYLQFAIDVSRQRHVPLQNKDVWANGKLFSGSEALKLKLIDAIGNQSTAIDYIKQNILHSDREISFVKTAQPSVWSQLFNQDSDEDDSQCSISDKFCQSFVRAFQKLYLV